MVDLLAMVSEMLKNAKCPKINSQVTMGIEELKLCRNVHSTSLHRWSKTFVALETSYDFQWINYSLSSVPKVVWMLWHLVNTNSVLKISLTKYLRYRVLM